MSGTESSDEEQESLDWRTRLATPDQSSNSTVPSTVVGVGAPSALDLGLLNESTDVSRELQFAPSPEPMRSIHLN